MTRPSRRGIFMSEQSRPQNVQNWPIWTKLALTRLPSHRAEVDHISGLNLASRR